MELTIIYTDNKIVDIFEDVYTCRQSTSSIIVFENQQSSSTVYTDSKVISESVANCYMIFEVLNIDTSKLDDYILESYYGY